jgi:hypothetical protein
MGSNSSKQSGATGANLQQVISQEPPTAPTTTIQMPKKPNNSNKKPINIVVKENKEEGYTINVQPNNTMNGGKRKSRKQKKSRKAKKTRKH